MNTTNKQHVWMNTQSNAIRVPSHESTKIFPLTLKVPWFISDLYSDFAPSRPSPSSVTQWACTCQQMTSPAGTCTTYRAPHLNFIMSRATCSTGSLLEAGNFRGFPCTFKNLLNAFFLRFFSPFLSPAFWWIMTFFPSLFLFWKYVVYRDCVPTARSL